MRPLRDGHLRPEDRLVYAVGDSAGPRHRSSELPAVDAIDDGEIRGIQRAEPAFIVLIRSVGVGNHQGKPKPAPLDLRPGQGHIPVWHPEQEVVVGGLLP